jgi:putative membrane protein
MMGYYGWGHVSPELGGLGLGIFFNVLFALAIAFVVISLIRLFVRGGMKNWENKEEEEEYGNALNILKERYAKGEINKKEFDSMKKDVA